MSELEEKIIGMSDKERTQFILSENIRFGILNESTNVNFVWAFTEIIQDKPIRIMNDITKYIYQWNGYVWEQITIEMLKVIVTDIITNEFEIYAKGIVIKEEQNILIPNNYDDCPKDKLKELLSYCDEVMMMGPADLDGKAFKEFEKHKRDIEMALEGTKKGGYVINNPKFDMITLWKEKLIKWASKTNTTERNLDLTIKRMFHTSEFLIDSWFFEENIKNKRVFLNGTYDYSTKTFTESFLQDDKIRNQLNFEYDKEAKCEYFEKLFSVWFPDKEIRDFAKMVLGYAVQNIHDEKLLYFCFGAKDSGKSSFINLLIKMFHNRNENLKYVAVAPASLFAISNSGESEKLASSYINKGIVICNELGASNCWNTLAIKQWTGHDQVASRILGANKTVNGSFNGTLFFTGNQKPYVSPKNPDTDFWESRMCIIPFYNHIGDGVEISKTELENNLSKEYAGIFNFFIEGYKMLQSKGGLLKKIIPEKIQFEIDSYKNSNNPYIDFVQDRLMIGTGNATISEIYKEYVLYVNKLEGERPEPKMIFTNNFKEIYKANIIPRTRISCEKIKMSIKI